MKEYLRKLWKFVKYALWVFLGLILLLAAWIGWGFYDYYHVDKDCFYRKDVVIKIGDNILAIPRKYRPVFHAPKGKKLPFADAHRTMLHICQKDGDPPVEVTSFSILYEKDSFLGITLDANIDSLKPLTEEQILTSREDIRDQLRNLKNVFKGQVWKDIALKIHIGKFKTENEIKNYETKVFNELKRWELNAKTIIEERK